MSDTLSTLKPVAGARRKPLRVGRGPGSGKGKTSGRGHKGMYSRSGAKHRAHKEGGQMPLYRRLPKRGFYNPFRVTYQVVNVGDLSAANIEGTVDPRALRKARLVRTVNMPVKVLGQGTVDRPIVISAHAFSKSAQDKITAAGGRCETVEFKAAAVSQETAA